MTRAQAGAIAIRRDGSDLVVLLVTSKRQPSHWIFPKGHIERGETAIAAALREAEEEAGITGTASESLGSLAYEWKGEKYRVQYFLVAASNKGRPMEGRDQLWCRFEEALKLLSFEDTRALLTSAWPRIQASDHLVTPAKK